MIEFLHYNQLNLYDECIFKDKATPFEWSNRVKSVRKKFNWKFQFRKFEKCWLRDSLRGFYFREMLHRSSTISIKGTISARNGSDELTSNYISAILYFQKIHKARASRYRSCLLTEFIFDAVSLHADIHHATTNFHVRLLFPSLSGFFTALVFFQASTRETIHW